MAQGDAQDRCIAAAETAMAPGAAAQCGSLQQPLYGSLSDDWSFGPKYKDV
jgi:hypothetical protein